MCYKFAETFVGRDEECFAFLDLGTPPLYAKHRYSNKFQHTFEFMHPRCLVHIATAAIPARYDKETLFLQHRTLHICALFVMYI